VCGTNDHGHTCDEYMVLLAKSIMAGVEVHKVEATAPIHEGLSEPGCPD
jgi:hypothetical protein